MQSLSLSLKELLHNWTEPVKVRSTLFFVFFALICVADHIRLTLFSCLMLESLSRIEQGQGGEGWGVVVI